MPFTNFRTSLLVGLSATALCAPAHALATADDSGQTTDATQAQAATTGTTPTADSGEIVVTALRRAESVLKTPAAITAIAGGDLRTKGVNTVADLQNLVPGVSVSSSQDGLTVGIRGVRTGDTSSKGEQDIAFSIDGAYVGRGNARGTSFFDIDRVEVLRGPQGTLYGRSSTGGAINLITNKPKLDDTSGYIRLEYGNYDTKRGEAAINLPLGDKVAVRFAGAFNDRDGYAKPVAYTADIAGVATPISTVGSHALNDQHDATGRASILFQPSDDVTARFTATVGRQGGFGGTNQVDTFLKSGSGSSALDVYATPYPSFVHNSFVNFDGNLNWKFGAVQLDVLGSHQHFKLDQERANTNNVEDTTNTGTFGGILEVGHTDTTQFEARLSNVDTGTIDYVVGANYFYENIYENGRLYIAPVATATDTTTWTHNFEVNNHTPHKAYGVFGQATWHLTDKLSAVGGLRYTHDEVTRTGYIAIGPCFTVQYPASCPSGQEFLVQIGALGPDANNGASSDNKITWRAGLNYQLDPNNLIYASAATGFKGGGFNDFSPSSATTTPYQPATITAYELGYKGRILAGLTLASDLFYYDFAKNQITGVVNVPSINQNGQYTATAPTTIYGWENEVSYKIASQTSISGTASFERSKYRNFLVGAYYGVQAQWRGLDLDQTPRTVLTGMFDHAMDIGDDSKLRFHAQMRYSAKYVLSDIGNAVRYWQPSSTRSDANITYEPHEGRFSIQLFVENIENKVQRVGSIGGYPVGGAYGGVGGSPTPASPLGPGDALPTLGNGKIPANIPAGYLNFATTTPRFFGVRLFLKL